MECSKLARTPYEILQTIRMRLANVPFDIGNFPNM